MGSVPLSLEQFLPEDAYAGTLVGRAWITTPTPGEVAGPAVIAIREGGVYDISGIAPTMCDLLEAAESCCQRQSGTGNKDCQRSRNWSATAAVGASIRRSRFCLRPAICRSLKRRA